MRRRERLGGFLLVAAGFLGMLTSLVGVVLVASFVYAGMTASGFPALAAALAAAGSVLLAILPLLVLSVLPLAVVDVWASPLPLQSRKASRTLRTALSRAESDLPALPDLSPVARFATRADGDVNSIDSESYGYHRRCVSDLLSLLDRWSDHLEHAARTTSLPGLLSALESRLFEYSPPPRRTSYSSPAVVSPSLPCNLSTDSPDLVHPSTPVLFHLAGLHPVEDRPASEYSPAQLALRAVISQVSVPFRRHPDLRACVAPVWVYQVLHADSMRFTRSAHLGLAPVGRCYVLDRPSDVRELLVGMWAAPHGFERSLRAAVKLDEVSRLRRPRPAGRLIAAPAG